MFEELRKKLGLVIPRDFSTVSEEDAGKLRSKFSGLPEDYLAFLKEVGFGNFLTISIYSGPISPDFVFGKKAKVLGEVVLFGDDQQGGSFGFELPGYRIIDIDSDLSNCEEGSASFSDFIHTYLKETEVIDSGDIDNDQ